ncbi:hypothetical protein [Pseudoramibacter faecis]|uniref:hypothetical protein n=1 Tax=Pseudoramibacter faecis TaxID=3108534 RepID=UPI002E788126|nr:hypothetical protein [Pseudoramibacter sp. HA2172]
MFKIHGEIDTAGLEAAVQKTIDNDPALRPVFETDESGDVYQHLGGGYNYILDLRDIASAEDPQKEPAKQMFTMIDNRTHSDGSFMFNFTLFRTAVQEYLFVSTTSSATERPTASSLKRS